MAGTVPNECLSESDIDIMACATSLRIRSEMFPDPLPFTGKVGAATPVTEYNEAMPLDPATEL